VKKIIFLLVLFLNSSYLLQAQGILRGKITDENGEPAIGTLVFLKLNKTKAANTDLDGNFSLKIDDSTRQTVVISMLGYQPIEEVIQLKGGKVLLRNFDLKPVSKEIKELVIEAKVNKSRDFYVEKMKINSATTIDFISSETLKKTGDSNASAAVARVSGVSTNGTLITVRGIGDRYVKTLINGSVIPTLDPLTNNIKLDLFPASLLDNLFITKTASADLPGDFSGALISLETKDFPDQLAINIESTFGYNNQSSFRSIVSTQRSSTEWLGYDSDLRDIDHRAYQVVKDEPSNYDQLVVLGLKDYYNSIGVNESTPWKEEYFKLGLVQLGLLEKGKFDDAEAFLEAKNKFAENNTNRNNAYKDINANAVKFGQSVPNNWDTKRRIAPLNFSQSFSIGNQVMFLNRPLGVIAGFRYSSAVLYDSVATLNRMDQLGANNEKAYLTKAIQQSTKETNGINGLIQLSYKFSPNHSFSALFMPNFLGVNNVRNFIDSANANLTLVSKDQFYEQRRQLVYQAKSQHYFPKTKSKIDFNFSYTFGQSKAPDFKNLQYGLAANNQNVIGGGSFPIRRFYRYLDDDLLDTRIKYELPIFEKPNLARKLKFGAAYLQSNKDSRQYEYFLSGGPYGAEGFENENVSGYLDLNDFGFNTYTNSSGLDEVTINKHYRRVNLDAYHTTGYTKIYSGFLLTDFTIVEKLRFSGGLRVEQTDTYTDVFKFDSLGYGINDQRRLQAEDIFIVNPGAINQLNFLPSANLIFKIKKDENAPMNLRLNYSRSIARPSVRELTETLIFDYEYRTFIFGNSNLKTVDINNYDIRFESYFKNGDNISVSLFYKTFVNHIELVQTTQGFTWQNADNSNVKGIEIDGKKRIIKGLELRANVTFTNSVTTLVQNNILVKNGKKIFSPVDTITRQMYGQAPYVINGILSYSFDSLGLNLAVAYNVQGPRLAIVSAQPKAIPDVYDIPRHLLDFKVSKTIGKHFSVSATVKDILNAPIRRSYKYEEGFSVDFDNYVYGTNYYLSVSYKF
jgi:outer membrane receptor protein involved in Fe transport